MIVSAVTDLIDDGALILLPILGILPEIRTCAKYIIPKIIFKFFPVRVGEFAILNIESEKRKDLLQKARQKGAPFGFWGGIHEFIPSVGNDEEKREEEQEGRQGHQKSDEEQKEQQEQEREEGAGRERSEARVFEASEGRCERSNGGSDWRSEKGTTGANEVSV
ncbi:MAG: hypothetical protein ACM3WP_05040 [Acidobacteriota bacterium]